MSTEVVKKAPVTQASIGKKIDKIFALRGKKAQLEAAVKAVEGEIAELDADLLDLMEKNGTTKTSSKAGTVSLSSSVVANVESWDEFLAFVYKKKYGHLLQRRVSDLAWRELQEQGVKVPGTTAFTKKKLRYTAAAA